MSKLVCKLWVYFFGETFENIPIDIAIRFITYLCEDHIDKWFRANTLGRLVLILMPLFTLILLLWFLLGRQCSKSMEIFICSWVFVCQLISFLISALLNVLLFGHIIRYLSWLLSWYLSRHFFSNLFGYLFSYFNCLSIIYNFWRRVIIEILMNSYRWNHSAVNIVEHFEHWTFWVRIINRSDGFDWVGLVEF